MKIVTLGEIMLRLKSPGLERFMQSPAFEATFGGGEANVAVSLANYGMDAKFVTALPENAIAEACVRELRGFGVDVSDIQYTKGRVGITIWNQAQTRDLQRLFTTEQILQSLLLHLMFLISIRFLMAQTGSISQVSLLHFHSHQLTFHLLLLKLQKKWDLQFLAT